MLAIFSDLQRTHKPEYIVRRGKYAQSYDVPERIDSILSAISEREAWSVIAPDDAGLESIYAVHDEGMIQYLTNAYTYQNMGNEDPAPVFPDYFPPSDQRRCPGCLEGQSGFYCTDLETPIEKHTWDTAVSSASCAWTGAMRLRSGESCVYALCRPPGHHAGPDFFGGYCYLNNVAIAARTLGENSGRVAVLDIDYHHGNGTQAIFYADPEVWYGSLHIDPGVAYPYFAGYEDETGSDEAQGANWNMPLPHGTSQDQYISALESLLERLITFNPRWLVVSAGFDTYVRDMLSTFQITTSGFHEIGKRIHALNRPTLVVQEGGYYVPDLGLNVVALLDGILG